MENKYNFRQRLEQVHTPNRRAPEATPRPDEVAITCEWCIAIEDQPVPKLMDAAKDLADYFQVSMGVTLPVTVISDGTIPPRAIYLTTGFDGKKRGFMLDCTPDRITVNGADVNGTAQGCYYLEDVMNLREAPFLPQCNGLRKEPLFSPRMVHSAYACDVFTPNYLRKIAHYGFDTILVFVNSPDESAPSNVDFGALISQAEQVGLDVYFYIRFSTDIHPDAPDAEAYFDRVYGSLFRNHPQAKGMVLVGESCRFPSKDPHVSVTSNEGCFLSPAPNPGWYPCSDYPQLLKAISKSVRKYSPDADIVFWTYNWGHIDESKRTALLRNIPEDITVEVNFALHHNVGGQGTTMRTLDYTIGFPGPSKVFQTESAVAKERGLKLYTMCNTAGIAWDFGSVPYIPVPYQWLKRHDQLLAAHNDAGLSGLMETHHYGFHPSFISEFAKWNFMTNAPAPDETLRKLAAREFSAETADKVLEAWQLWSDAQGAFVTPIEDQYGPSRLGPSYPLLFRGDSLRITWSLNHRFPWSPKTLHKIALPVYVPVNDPDGLEPAPRRIAAEIKLLPELIAKWSRGVALLEECVAQLPERKQPSAQKMIALGKYCLATLRTTLHTKQCWVENNLLMVECDNAKAEEILQRIEAITRAELANVEETKTFVDVDSALGYEPTMDYVCDQERLDWKIRQLRSVLEVQIPYYRKGFDYSPKE